MEACRSVLIYINEREKIKDCIYPYCNNMYQENDELELMSIIDTETLDAGSSSFFLFNRKKNMLQKEIKKRKQMLIKAKKILLDKFKKRNVEIRIKMNVIFSSNVSYSKNLTVFARNNGIDLIVVGGDCFIPFKVLHWNNKYVRIEKVDNVNLETFTKEKGKAM